jgi:hypothetical protein
VAQPFYSNPQSAGAEGARIDRALIKWLEANRDWLEYEAKILRELTAPAVRNDLAGEPDPLKYFLNWPLDGLLADARGALRSGLLVVHGARLGGTMDTSFPSIRASC